MAQVIPEKAKPTESRAELLMFELLKNQLPADFVVFHSYSFRKDLGETGKTEGELDFVVIAPNLGVLVIEVKGGNITYENGLWMSGRYHIKDPFDQAQRAQKELERIFKHRYVGHGAVMGYCVAFPDSRWTLNDNPAFPKWLVIDGQGIDGVGMAVKRILKGWRAKYPASTESFDHQEIINLLAPRFDLRLTQKILVDRENKVFSELREQQKETLNVISRVPRAMITGGAGSGKTMLAAEAAKRFSEDGLKTMFVCFNKLLAAEIRKGFHDNTDIEIETFHELLLKLVHSHGQKQTVPEGLEAQRLFWNDTLPNLATDCADTKDKIYDCIICDEGQDFMTAWWLALESIYLKENGKMHVFADPEQLVYRESFQPPDDMIPIDLKEAIRCTKQIYKYARSVGHLPLQDMGEVDGPEPIEIEYQDSEDARKRLGNALNKLIKTEEIPANQIVILGPHNLKNSSFGDNPKVGNYELYDARNGEKGKKNQIRFYTIQSFKGLESPIVILVDVVSEAKDPQCKPVNLYVAASRACNRLIVLKGV